MELEERITRDYTPCTPEENERIYEATEFILANALQIGALMETFCQEKKRDSACAGKVDIKYAVKIAETTVYSDKFCPQSGEYNGRSLRDKDGDRPGQIAIAQHIFEEGRECELVRVIVHEAGHASSGIAHKSPDRSTYERETDMIDLAGIAAEARCNKKWNEWKQNKGKESKAE